MYVCVPLLHHPDLNTSIDEVWLHCRTWVNWAVHAPGVIILSALFDIL